MTITKNRPSVYDLTLESFSKAMNGCFICRNCMKGTHQRAITGEPETVCALYEYNGRNKIYSSQNLWGTAKSILYSGMQISPALTDLLYQCTTCGQCKEQCIVSHINDHRANQIYLVEYLRSEMVKKGYGVPIHLKFGEHIKKEHNPYMEAHKDRWDWLPNKEALPEKAEYVFFVGCTSSYRQTQIAKATVNILEKMGLDYTVMWRPEMDEWCCGSPLQRTGQVDKAKTVAEHNLEAIKKTGAKKIITSCSGCYKMIGEDYKELYGLEYDFEIVQSSQFLLDKVKSGELKLTKPVNMKVTYHDPCHSGRHMGVYEPPRELLKSIPGIELVEMPRNRENSWCCGAGGGVRAAYPDITMFASTDRIKEAEDTGAQALTSICPFCWTGLHEAIEENESKLGLYDVIELVEKAIE
jgi:heterodisulfide reductase subunit D